MAKKKTQEVLQKYYDTCNELLKIFCKKQEIDYEEAKDSWVGDNIGEIVDCGGSFFNMSDIITDLRYDAPAREIYKWYDYSITCHNYKLDSCNYYSWLRGCPRYTEEELEEAHKYNQKVADAEDRFEKYLKELRIKKRR